MRDRTWKWVLVLAVAGFCLCSLIDSPALQAASKGGGVLRYGMLSDPVNWAPHNVAECQSQVVMAQVWSGLLRYDDKDQITGDLAETFKWVDDKTIVFNLRKNVKWHNGDLLTAEHVVKSENHRLNPNESIDAKNLNDIVEKWEAVDPNTVKLTLKRPDITILRWLTTAPGKDFVLHPDWNAKTCGQSPETTIGTGPFKLKSYEPGVGVQLVKNPNYYIQGMPLMDGIKYIIIPDNEARLTGLLAGELDMVEFIDFQALSKVKGNNSVYIPEGGRGFYGCRLVFDLVKEPTNDIKVRRALNFAVDRNLIVEAVLNGEGAPIWGGMVPQGRFGYAKELDNRYSYDPQKAKAMLAEAGWVFNEKDKKVYKNGQPMKLSFITYGPSWWSQTAEIVQANFREIGVEVELQVKPWPEYREVRTKVLELPEGTASNVNIIGGTIWGLELSDMPIYMMTGGFINFNRYNNPKARELLKEAFATKEDAKREDLFRKIQGIMLDDAVDITPCLITRSEVVRSTVKNFHHLAPDGCFGTMMWEVFLTNN